MSPSNAKCPRCGTLRPSGEVAHTCVARDPADTGTSREGDPYAEIAALRAELERKDAALKELCKDEPLVEPEWIESDNHGDIRSNASDITRWHLAKIARAALQPKEPPCQTA